MAHNAELTQCWIDQNGIDFYADVALVLGRATTDEGRLCSDTADGNDPGGKVNKAAKFKPVIRANELDCRSVANWWRGNDGKCGLGFTVFEQLSDFVDAVLAGSSQLLWPYNAPQGEMAAPFRIADFDYYHSRAELLLPDTNGYQPEYEIQGNDANSPSAYVLNGYVNPAVAQYSLRMADIYPTSETDDPLSEYYFGAVFINAADRSKWCVATAPVKVGNLNLGAWNALTVLGASSVTGTGAYSEMIAVPFFSSEYINRAFNQAWTDDVSGNFISCNGRTGHFAYFHYQGYYDLEVDANLYWRASDPYVRGAVTIRVTSGPLEMDVTLHTLDVNIVRKRDLVELNGMPIISSMTLTAGFDERAEGTIQNIAIYAPEYVPGSEEGDSYFNPDEEYIVQFYCVELRNYIYSLQKVIVLN